mgnify:CR=1 FL=1
MTEFPYKSGQARAAALGLRGFTRGLSAGAFSQQIADFSGLLSRLIERECDARRPFLFLAPAAMLGVLLYFAADEEPAVWAPFVALLPVIALIAYGRTRAERGALDGSRPSHSSELFV